MENITITKEEFMIFYSSLYNLFGEYCDCNEFANEALPILDKFENLYKKLKEEN